LIIVGSIPRYPHLCARPEWRRDRCKVDGFGQDMVNGGKFLPEIG
jgi:hypothetical protein